MKKDQNTWDRWHEESDIGHVDMKDDMGQNSKWMGHGSDDRRQEGRQITRDRWKESGRYRTHDTREVT